jgi:DNA-binding IscR family transcriptional regulator
LPDFVDTALKEIDDQIRALKDEATRLEAARAALTGGSRRSGRRVTSSTVRTRSRSTSRRDGRSAAAPRTPRGGNTRANQALELVRKQPGITIPEIAQAMKIQPNYLYRVLPRLASEGEIKRDGQGWHASTGSTSTRSAAKPRRRAQSATSKPAAPAERTGRRRARSSSTSNGRTARGATTASVLAALAGGEAMTAGQVATKAGLARPTVSTTLSKLAKSGEIQKAARGYRLAAA